MAVCVQEFVIPRWKTNENRTCPNLHNSQHAGLSRVICAHVPCHPNHTWHPSRVIETLQIHQVTQNSEVNPSGETPTPSQRKDVVIRVLRQRKVPVQRSFQLLCNTGIDIRKQSQRQVLWDMSRCNSLARSASDVHDEPLLILCQLCVLSTSSKEFLTTITCATK